jgi:hypothetical protein
MSRTCTAPDTLVVCADVGAAAVVSNCPWGCLDDDGTADCGVLQPVGGGAVDDDLAPVGADVTLDTGNDIDSGGTITGIPSGDFETGSNNNIRVFRFKSLVVNGTITLTGNRPIVLIADGAITINGIIDARGPCANGAGRNGGPGGTSGGADTAAAAPPGNGTGGSGNAEGGGGGGHAANGGTGNSGNAGGGVYGDAAIGTLTGGGGGGGGQTSQGGGGGGAIQLISNTSITIVATGGINAGGCGGGGGDGGSNDAGGGGGAGGTIVREAPTACSSLRGSRGALTEPWIACWRRSRSCAAATAIGVTFT